MGAIIIRVCVCARACVCVCETWFHHMVDLKSLGFLLGNIDFFFFWVMLLYILIFAAILFKYEIIIFLTLLSMNNKWIIRTRYWT